VPTLAPLLLKHTKRAGMHSISGLSAHVPLPGHFRRLGKGGGYPLHLDCTRARFVCLYFVRFGEYLEIFWRGFSTIDLQIPLCISIFRRAYPLERPGLSSFATFIADSGRESSWACKRANACTLPCTPSARSRPKACRGRARDLGGRHPPPPFRLLPRQRGRPVDDLLREVAAHIVLTAEPAMQRGKMPQSASLTSRADMQVRGYAVVMHGSDMKDLRISETRRAASSGFAE